jgi:bis(5'-nucleosidyl)-tetraphosphatase
MPPDSQNKDRKPQSREISAGIVVFRRTPEGPKFLILYHGGSYWNFPKGHIEHEENDLTAALRETKEEAGLGAKDLQLLHNFKAYERFTFRRGGGSVFKIVIFYLAETRLREIKISDEHQGYGWFSYRDASKILGKYRDSQKVLRQAFDFLRARQKPQPTATTTHAARPQTTTNRPFRPAPAR